VNARCLLNPHHDEVQDLLDADKFFWMDLEEADAEKLERVGAALKLHPLTIEDLQTFDQNPRFDEFATYAYLVIYAVDPGVRAGAPLLREVHLVISGQYVMTVRKAPLAALQAVRDRYHDVEMRSEQQLIYRILDALTGTFFPVLSRVDDDIDEIEAEVIDDASEDTLQRIFSLKRDLVAMRRVVIPLRDVFARNAGLIADLPGMEGDDHVYFRDLFDTMIRVADLVDSYRDLLSGATDMYLATVANRQGDVNRQLTIIATIFLPLTFLTGFFGQNFKFLVKDVIASDWSFWVFGIGLLAVSVGLFIWLFRRNKWL
jgi:magnesium transporter